MTTNPLELLMQVANGHTVYDGATRRVVINKHTWESIQTWANPRRSFDYEPPNNEINTAVSGLRNAYVNTPISRDMLFGACVSLTWATNACDDENYDLASAVAGVEATLDSEDITLNELWTRLAGDLTRQWERSLPLPEWWM